MHPGCVYHVCVYHVCMHTPVFYPFFVSDDFFFSFLWFGYPTLFSKLNWNWNPFQQGAEGAVLTTTSQCEFRSLVHL